MLNINYNTSNNIPSNNNNPPSNCYHRHHHHPNCGCFRFRCRCHYCNYPNTTTVVSWKKINLFWYINNIFISIIIIASLVVYLNTTTTNNNRTISNRSTQSVLIVPPLHNIVPSHRQESTSIIITTTTLSNGYDQIILINNSLLYSQLMRLLSIIKTTTTTKTLPTIIYHPYIGFVVNAFQTTSSIVSYNKKRCSNNNKIVINHGLKNSNSRNNYFLCWNNNQIIINSREFLTSKSTMTTTMMTSTQTPAEQHNNNNELTPLHDFLVERKNDFVNDNNNNLRRSNHHYIIGNEAGDADSIISSIVLAYILSLNNSNDYYIPIVSITEHDLLTQRPETRILLEKFTSISLHDIIYINELQNHIQNDMKKHDSNEEKISYHITLVDHNHFKDSTLLLPTTTTADTSSVQIIDIIEFNIITIYDHHYDSNFHLDTCTKRNIAYDNDKQIATVASTCTLLVELLQKHSIWKDSDGCKYYPSELSIVLLGVMLLDSINMNQQIGKGTYRDQLAINHLLDHTDWSSLPSIQSIMTFSTRDNKPDCTLLFEMLQNAKFDIFFWKSLSMRDTIRLDYKNFVISTNNLNIVRFGISTVLLSWYDFWDPIKQQQQQQQDSIGISMIQQIYDYILENNLDFLGIMFASTTTNQDNDHVGNNDNNKKQQTMLKRQLMLCSISNSNNSNQFPLHELVSYMNDNNNNGNDDGTSSSLNLMEIMDNDFIILSTLWNSNNNNNEGGRHPITILSFEQGTSEASRKQVAPIMIRFVEQQHM